MQIPQMSTFATFVFILLSAHTFPPFPELSYKPDIPVFLNNCVHFLKKKKKKVLHNYRKTRRVDVTGVKSQG